MVDFHRLCPSAYHALLTPKRRCTEIEESFRHFGEKYLHISRLHGVPTWDRRHLARNMPYLKWLEEMVIEFCGDKPSRYKATQIFQMLIASGGYLATDNKSIVDPFGRHGP